MKSELQPCGHPVACVEGKVTRYCSMCALEAERDAALERVNAYESPRPLTGDKKGELHRRASQGDWVAKEVIALRERVRELTERRPMETAPRDGTAILLIESFGESRVIARWVDDTWASACAYSGTFYTDDDDYYHGWLPLPSAPATD
jgi:hypothetical protein